MLVAEEAESRLASIRDPEWRAHALRRVHSLNRNLRGPAEAFLAEPPAGFDAAVVNAQQKAQIAAAENLDKLSATDLAAVMAALHPGLGAALTRWWVDAQGRPYGQGWTRKAFRAPASPLLTRRSRTIALATVVEAFGPFDADPAWVAVWAGHIVRGRQPLSQLPAVGGILASAVDIEGSDGDDVFQTLVAVGNGEHEIGVMGRHVIGALLTASRPEGWQWVRRLLLAAQRQEGLRQAVLEAADEGHPEAFDLILATVLEQNLLRFAATIRAAGVWLGFGAAVTDIPKVEVRVTQLAEYRRDEEARKAALTSGDPWQVYIALCALGMRDVRAANQEAMRLFTKVLPDVRVNLVRFMAATNLVSAQKFLAVVVREPNLRVASYALASLMRDGLRIPTTFDAIVGLIERLPERASTAPPPEDELAVSVMTRPQAALRLIDALGERSPSELLPWLPVMDVAGRTRFLAMLRREGTVPPEIRAALVDMAGDRSSNVRRLALGLLKKTTLQAVEAPAVEAMLTRGATDVRRGALTLLASLPVADARASANRLAQSDDERQRDAAEELLREIGGGLAGATEFAGIDDLRVVLVDETKRVAPKAPRLVRPQESFADDAARSALAGIDELAWNHRNARVLVTSWQGSAELLFGDIKWFPRAFGVSPVQPADDVAEPHGMVLGDIFRSWWASRPATMRNDDGLDELRAYVLASTHLDLSAFAHLPAKDWWREHLRGMVGPAPDLRMGPAVRHVTSWQLVERLSTAIVDECLDALETSLAMAANAAPIALPESAAAAAGCAPIRDWRRSLDLHVWFSLLNSALRLQPAVFGREQIARWYALMRWVERPYPAAAVRAISDKLTTAAFEHGVATRDDVRAALLYPKSRLFVELTRRWRTQLEARQPALVEVADEVRDRVIATELRRGDLPTPTSDVARNIGSTAGAGLVVELLRMMGKAPLVRGWTATGDSRDAVFSHLIQVCHPELAETAATLLAKAKAAKLPTARLVDLAVYAPQWAPLIEEGLGWDGLTDGVLWLHAHTKDQQWTVDADLRAAWAAMVAERTPLLGADLVAGAVDVDWFKRSYDALGDEHWRVLYKAAKHASGGTGHRRAQVFAEAMLGQIDEKTLVDRVSARRNQDAVRALGLIPLPIDPSERNAAVQRRYAVMREFERGSNAFGSQRQTSERLAVRIGIENLARTAGYVDPMRFVWAVEAREAGELAAGPISIVHGDITLTLAVDGEGSPQFNVTKNGRPMSAVPAALRKSADVVELRARKTALSRQSSRVRTSLEAAMVGGDRFANEDFEELSRHPVVAPMLARLLWVDDEGHVGRRVGHRALVDVDGEVGTPVGLLRVAHPVDLVAAGDWVRWQESVFADGRRQPFKQAFRELYVLTETEKRAGPASHRYDGHQLQPRQALALLGRRGWLTSRDSGDVSRVFHQYNLVARVDFVNGFLTPLEVELPTIAGVYFTRRGEHLAQPFESVPPIVFSETMRDLDLVVSVAHAGGVDPEATASTTEMRAALIRETARLLKVPNLSFAGDHVLIEGRLGEYSVHLGSGIVHRRPGAAVCIIAVGAQHRGRMFLPFADDDPKTAEIVAKVLLLARDHQIKDPSILEQLRS